MNKPNLKLAFSTLINIFLLILKQTLLTKEDQTLPWPRNAGLTSNSSMPHWIIAPVTCQLRAQSVRFIVETGPSIIPLLPIWEGTVNFDFFHLNSGLFERDLFAVECVFWMHDWIYEQMRKWNFVIKNKDTEWWFLFMRLLNLDNSICTQSWLFMYRMIGIVT